jgi:hypothetical protein
MAVLDQATVFQEANLLPEEVRKVLKPVILGPGAELHRHSEPAEKSGIDLGAYVSGANTTYTWPGKVEADSLVDLASAKLFIDAALLRYFQDLIGSGGTVAPVSGYPNRVRTTASNGFKTNGAFARATSLKDRDVAIGDIVHLKNGSNELYTSVRSLIADVVAASIGSASADAINPSTQSFADTVTQTSGTANDVTEAEDGTLYDGLTSGYINETYTILCIQGSSGGNATTARLQVTAGSGTDDQASIAPAVFGSATSIGTRGGKVTFGHTSDEFVVGQTWLLTIAQAFTKPVATAGGTYTGSTNRTYIIEVTRGGKYTDVLKPQITVTSDVGTDASGPTTITAAATNFSVGTLGVLVQFSGTSLRKGDKYYIVATGPTAGAYKTLELNDNMSATMTALSDLDLELSLAKDIEVPQQRASSPPTLNWTTTASSITVAAGIDAYDNSFTDAGALFAVTVVSGPNTKVHAEYRAWKAKVSGSLSAPADVAAVLGTVDPDNPLAYGVHKALENSNGRAVGYLGVANPDSLASWEAALDSLVGSDYFAIVPMTFAADVQDAVKAHVVAEAVDDLGSWRRAWLSVQADETVAIVDEALTTDAAVAKATLADNPNVAGTQYTYLACTTGNAKFVTKGVAAGDTVRYLYSIDAFGGTTYSEYTVASVVNEDTLILASGPGAAVSTAQKFEIWRHRAAADVATALAVRYGALADKRINAVWPDAIDTDDGADLPGYFLAAGLAGFVAGVAPHQGIEGIPLTGFTAAPRSISFFNTGQLNTLQAGGGFVVTQVGDDILVRAARTTDPSSDENSLEVVVRNDDAIRHVIYNRIGAYFGVASATEAGLTIVRSEVEYAMFVLESSTFVGRLGNMAIDHAIDVRLSTISPDAIVVQMTITRPFPIQQLELDITFDSVAS